MITAIYTAYRFALSKKEAIKHAGLVPDICLREGRLSGVGAQPLPFLAFRWKQPTKATALYFPGWIIDAEIEAKVWPLNVEKELPLQPDSPELAQLKKLQ